MNSHNSTPKHNPGAPALDLLARLCRHISTWALLMAMLVAIGAYYWREWKTFNTFVLTMDHHSRFMLLITTIQQRKRKENLQELWTDDMKGD